MDLQIRKTAAGLALGLTMVLGAPAGADDWDVGPDSDGGLGTDNALFHGAEQVHDLGAIETGPTTVIQDQDWYLTSVHPFSSYSFVVDGFTGDLDLTSADVLRTDVNGNFLESALISDAGGVLSLNWLRESGGSATETNFVRITGASCGFGCGTADTYRARFYDTTYTIPRFNNSGTQTTVLLIQNATDRTCGVAPLLLSPSGTFIASMSPGAVAPNRLLVLATATAAPNQSGSVRIVHTCGYGGLSGKAVALEPATGFAFDTPMTPRPR